MTGSHAVLRPAEQLARSAPSQLEDARRHVGALLAAARELTAVLPAEGADPAWVLARRLATLPAAPPAATARDLHAADAAFRTALLDALDAVRACRQTRHVSGACWFAAEPGVDGCGDVLRTAHAVS